MRDRDAAVSDAYGKALILISYSASRNLVGTMYKNSAVPAMIWDGAILSDMGMVTSTGSVSGQSQINIIDASHPMADGHSNGNVTIASSGTKVRWGFPTASADSIAEVAGQPTKSAIFAYQTGDSMNGINAPHRRVGFFIDSTTPVDLNANGWGLFDAAVDWAINGGSSTYMPNPNQAIATAGVFKGNRMGKRGTSAKIQAISGSIQRISLSFAGGPVAVQVSGDPDPADNGLFHIYADHLGSTGSLSDSSGVYIPDSHAKYTPFGDWRTEPTATASDRYYTGHKHNNLGGGADDLGLIYMNARYYLPGVGRFASADSIVPDPNSPQNFNRYSYVLNNPMRLLDPSGHVVEIFEGDDEFEDPYDEPQPDHKTCAANCDEYLQWTWEQFWWAVWTDNEALATGYWNEIRPYILRSWKPSGEGWDGLYNYAVDNAWEDANFFIGFMLASTIDSAGRVGGLSSGSNEFPIVGLPNRGGQGKTTGYLFDSSGNKIGTIVSGRNQYSFDENLVRGHKGPYMIQDHVEAQAAGMMRDLNVTEATLVLNNHPCAIGVNNCQTLLKYMIPEGSTLNVIVPKGFDARGVYNQSFTGASVP